MPIIEGEIKGKAGRTPNPIVYNELEDCVECIVLYNGNSVKFLIDKDDLENVKTRNWHLVTGGKYVGAVININNRRKTLYLHNFVMNKLTFEGHGQKETVDHINRDGLDNRKQNLRIVSQTLQNINQNKKSRRVVLPPEYNLNPNDFPKHVHYVKARGNHGDGFCVEFKLNGKKIYNPYIRSKVLSIEDKFKKILELLKTGYELYPNFNPNYLS